MCVRVLLIFCIVAKLVLFFNKISVIYVLISCFGMVNEALYPEMNPDDPFLFFCWLHLIYPVGSCNLNVSYRCFYQQQTNVIACNFLLNNNCN